MPYVIRIGPLRVIDAPPFNLYLALDEAQVTLGPVASGRDADGLEELRQIAAGSQLICEPALNETAEQLGLECAPLPSWAAEHRALCALTLALDSSYSPALLRAWVEACAELQRARPWDRWQLGEPFRVRLSGAVRGERVAMVTRGPEATVGLAMYDDPRAAELASTCDGLDLTSMIFDEQNAFALTPLREGFGVCGVPHVQRAQRGAWELPSEAELLAMMALIRAVSIAPPSAAERIGRADANGLRVEAVVEVPEPRLPVSA